MLLKNL